MKSNGDIMIAYVLYGWLDNTTNLTFPVTAISLVGASIHFMVLWTFVYASLMMIDEVIPIQQQPILEISWYIGVWFIVTTTTLIFLATFGCMFVNDSTNEINGVIIDSRAIP